MSLHVHVRNMLLPCTFLSALKMSIENNMRRRSPKLLCEVLKSKNVVCTPNYNVINSYLPFSFFSFFYDNVIAIRCISYFNFIKIILLQLAILF